MARVAVSDEMDFIQCLVDFDVHEFDMIHLYLIDLVFEEFDVNIKF